MTLAYDPAGRLMQVAKSGTITQFLYDATRLVAEYNGAGTLLRRYVHGSGVDQPLLWYEGAGTSDKRRLYADERGSVIAVEAAGGVTKNTYDAYGVPGAGNAGRFQYTGQAWLSEVSLYHYKARAYAPLLGRFMQTDPIGYADQMNLYAYVGNDPVNGRDPSGREMEAFLEGMRRAKIEQQTGESVESQVLREDGPIAAGIGIAIEYGLIGVDLVLGGPTGEGIGPALALRGGREYVESLAGKGIREIGEYGENRDAQEITAEGGEIIARQEPLSTRSRADIIYRDSDGSIVCCEVKAGRTADTAPLSPRQTDTKSAVNSGKDVHTRDGTKIDRYEERRYPIVY